MKITSHLFEAFLKCPTKCWLRSLGESDTGNEYATWVKSQTEAYRIDGIMRLTTDIAPNECVANPPETGNPKAGKWRLALDFAANTQSLESTIHAVERVPSEGRGKAATFIPIRFIFTNKLTRDDKLLVAFDAVVLSEVLGRGVELGKIIHGDNYSAVKVKTSGLAGEVRKRIEGTSSLLASSAPPDLILNRHCGECEFRTRCRQKAIEKDDLSLLAGMSEKERKELHSKGIFTVTQLSYTFRPRRRPKRLRDKKEKYHHALKALAIREKKIHTVGTPELKIEGTLVYLDVEGLPDRDFYYLIGVRIDSGETAVQHSFWADTLQDEGKIWREFLASLETVEKPVLIHYGSYETTFLKTMVERYGEPAAESMVASAIKRAVNVLSIIFAQVYFPTYSNGLKEVAGWLGYKWAEPNALGINAIQWRSSWQESESEQARSKLINYNLQDSEALELVASVIQQLSLKNGPVASSAIHADAITRRTPWKKFASSIPNLEQINKAAQWDYQRSRVRARLDPERSVEREEAKKRHQNPRVDTVINYVGESKCPHCHADACRQTVTGSRIVRDMKFGTRTIKGRVIEYKFQYCWCGKCRIRFGAPPDLRTGMKYGWNFISYVLYQIIELLITQSIVQRSLSRLFGFDLNLCVIAELKARAAGFYKDTQRIILDRLANGSLVQVDETMANVKGKTAYVWVFTGTHGVAYLYADSREGDVARTTLSGFKGVLVSDFYSVYDSFECPQQKCLIHLVRDLNDELLNCPFDEELKRIVTTFGELLRAIVETVDRYGLKRHFLKKHLRSVDRFYKQIEKTAFHSEAAVKWKNRFEKNRHKLFTFLEHDGVPWNNNNAEHAVKAFALLRDILRGSSTLKGLEDYLVLLSVCQTCKYMGIDFLDFLRSGEKDIHKFAESKGRRKRNKPRIEETPATGPSGDGEAERPL